MDNNLRKSTMNNLGSPEKSERNVAALSDVAKSLLNAASRLQTIKQLEINNTFANLEVAFPEGGIDFRKAKKQYETNLVKQALRSTGGHQAKAAKLLKLRGSTLNSIIKRNNIDVNKFMGF